MDQPLLRLDVCPMCGATEDFSITATEQMYGHVPIEISTAPDGTLFTSKFGVIEAHWESSVTLEYMAECCCKPLPEEYQQALDKALDNYRQSDDDPISIDSE